MNNEQKMVKEFHYKFGIPVATVPRMPEPKIEQLRDNLNLEEAGEFATAKTLEEKIDALGDLLYVVYGAGLAYGVDLEPVFTEIHRSNMTKAWTGLEVSSQPAEFWELNEAEQTNNEERSFVVKRKKDGKVLKSPSYSPADIKYQLDKQRAAAH
jgi:predicted HAD superfamily Cof-like phosphohydrolase